MPEATYDRGCRRKAVNLSVDAELLSEARGLDLNLSRILEERLAEAVAGARRAAWIRANRPAIEDFNRRVKGRGVYGDRARRF